MACPEVRLVEVMMVVKFQECRYEISKHKKSTILCGEQFKHIKVAATGYSYQMVVVPTIKISGPSLSTHLLLYLSSCESFLRLDGWIAWRWGIVKGRRWI